MKFCAAYGHSLCNFISRPTFHKNVVSLVFIGAEIAVGMGAHSAPDTSPARISETHPRVLVNLVKIDIFCSNLSFFNHSF